MKYDHKQVEKKWQDIWDEKQCFHAENDSDKEKFYALVEFPYPSGQGLHVGHPRSYTALDIVARKKRMQGYNVLYPMGWDAFGLPTENFAIKNHVHPAEVTKKNIARFKSQLKSLGLSFDWSREINTTDPSYYKWTQWIFLQLFKKGLAYKKEMSVNWCTSCKCVLANEEVVNGVCERCGSEVVHKTKSQWMLAITKYAQRLIDDLDDVDYIERVKIQQRNWIGRSTGAEVDFKTTEGDTLTVYTTRPDTLFGATYMVISPEHPMIEKWADKLNNINSDQFFLNLLAFPDEWGGYPFIKVDNKEILQWFGRDGKYIAWQDVFDADGNYVLTDEVNAIYAKAASERKRMDSDLLKLDESVNIVYRIMQHQLLPLFPDENDAQGKWYSAGDEQTVFHDKDSLFVSKIMDWYIYELGNGVRTNNWKEADKIVDMMHIFQQAKSKTPAIDNQRVKAELLYNQLNLFFWCRLAYLILGGILLFIACGEIIADFKWGSKLSSILIVLLVAAFLAHTTGVLLRWYISERAPWANAYESMICTSWLLVGGGLLFARRFRILPALAGLLGGIMLFVAGLNHLNPEITPLVPVLQSYWLMSHVAIIMIGYVFFALCALTGLFNLILMNLLSATNRVKLLFRIREFTLLNEMAMILGLFFMTAGTFLGAIWANVSWGRYWGWDPKETWALISIVVYALVLHIRFIPLLKGKTTWCFNLLSVVSILSIIMTWFGVNYYLSGLHSYGKTEGGDLLLWIWGAGLCVVLALALFARRRLKKYS